MADITSPLPFIGVTPCRVADTRGNGFTLQAGPPNLTTTGSRDFQIGGAVPGVPSQCGIPSTAAAVSFNFAVTDIGGNGNLIVYPTGASQPVVSSLNYQTGFNALSNAAIIPLGTSASITVKVNGPFHGVALIIDVNGYYASTPANTLNYFEVTNSSGWAILGKTTSSGFLSRGVFGQASATTGVTKGVFGETDSSSDGAAGVEGYAPTGGGFGVTYGVRGVTGSPSAGAAGVYGVNGSGSPAAVAFDSAGVLGVSAADRGVVGLGGYKGVTGFRFSGIDVGTGGVLGYDNTYGVFAVGSYGCNSCANVFMDPHPTDASKEIAYVALEGPEAGTYFRGRGRIHNGTGIIEVPESFRMVSDEEGLTVQITPIGQVANVAVVSFDLDTIVVKSLVKELEFFYLVNGVHRPFKHWSAIQENKHYVPEGPNARMPLVFAPEHRRALIATGIYNEDGTVNLETAERLGWAKAWRDREEQAKAAAAASRAARQAKGENK